MRSRHAVVGFAVLALAAAGAIWLRVQSARADAIEPGSNPSQLRNPERARLDAPSSGTDAPSVRPDTAPAAESVRTPMLEQVVWSGVRVTGSIVDDRRNPIGRAFVSLLARPPDWKSGDPEQVLAQTATPESGRFELEASMPNRVFLVRAGHPDHEGVDSDVLRPGASELTLVLPAITGTIAGRVLVDECVPLRDLMVILAYESPAPQSGAPGANVRAFLKRAQPGVADLTAPLAPDGTFLLEQVREGLAYVRVCANGGVETFGVVEHVEVRRNETTRDARLDPLDLRGLLHCYELHVVDAEGEPVRVGDALVLSREQASARPVLRRFERGELRLLTCMTCFDVELRAPFFRDESLTCVNGPREVVMRAGLEVSFEVTNLPALGADQSILFALTSLTDPISSISSFPGYGTEAQTGDGAIVQVGAPGRYRVRARLRSPSGAGQELDFGGQELPTIDVRDVAGVQYFRVALPPATLRLQSVKDY